MKYVIISDIHADVQALERFVKSVREFPKDGILCLGDIIHRGSSFEDNRVVDLIRDAKVLCIKGNHEEDLKEKSKILQSNEDYLRSLGNFKELDNLIAYHSSLRFQGRRLRTEQDLLEEAHHLQDNYPNIDFALFGHTHKTTVFSYNQNGGYINPIQRKITLDSGKLHLINPGSIGVKYSLQSLMVLDTDNYNVYCYSLDDFEKMHARSVVIRHFEEEWMPHLTGNDVSWKSLMAEAKSIGEHLNRNEDLDDVVKVMKSLSPPDSKNKKSRYYQDFSLRLANSIYPLFDVDISDHYELDNPLNARDYYLSAGKRDFRGVSIHSHLRIVD